MSNYQNIKYVVGNQFEEFSKRKEKILIESELNSLINNDPSELENSTIIFGQGSSEKIKQKITEYISSNQIDIATPNKHIQAADTELTHKCSKKNILVSIPRQLDDKNYASDLLIDSPAELDDHVTGQHVPGILLIEAARQLFIAVLEKFFLCKKDSQKKYYFVMHNMSSNFTDYVFPLPTKMYLEVEKFSNKNPNKINSSSKISFFQIPGRFCCSVEYNFSMINTKIISRLENNNANEVIQLVN